MGNKQSRAHNEGRGPVMECDCERVMPEVIKECCESVSAGVENTFLTGLNGVALNPIIFAPLVLKCFNIS